MLRQVITISLLAFPIFGYTQPGVQMYPPKEELGVIVFDKGTGLDTSCRFRSEGPLVIDIPIPAVVNEKEINADGTLKDASKLIRNQVIGAKARIIFPGWDVDDKATFDEVNPEVDTIKFNDKFVGIKTGLNDQWVLQQFEVDIQDLKFAHGTNTLRIDIDTANVGNGDIWCTAVDWVAVKFDVAAPYVLAHGITGDMTTWDESNSPGVLQALDETGVLYTRFSTGANGSITENGRDLMKKIGAFLKEHKSDKIHAIAHSKGGLDIQAMVALMPKNNYFKVISLSTLSTPHYGSILADLSMLALLKNNNIRTNGPDNGWLDIYLTEAWLATQSGRAPEPPGLSDLQTRATASAISIGFAGNISPTYTIGANADLNQNRSLDESEVEGMPVEFTALWSPAWHILRDHASAHLVETQKKIVFGVTVWTTIYFEATNTSTARDNDLSVTTFSANPDYGQPLGDVSANHATVKSGENIQKILDKTVPMR
ncbi:MAG: alpha/beta hydrolase [Candidatus Competibacteraceae bacterium]|nr:alpha/beta hydrolase [Candidatus Competibacteraceae bacterium]